MTQYPMVEGAEWLAERLARQPHASPRQLVFNALLNQLGAEVDKAQWRGRWEAARLEQQKRSDRDRAYDDSLLGVGHDQSGYPFVKRYGQ